MAACNTETILARALNGQYARAGDEAYALIREALCQEPWSSAASSTNAGGPRRRPGSHS
jgi:hypothetical protein